jgi:phosphopantothenoylcysteine decarboxylase / phosphopantothenate---cysteine ligase
MARILLGVSGGIAAHKALELVRLATDAGHAVRVIQTPASTHFIGPAAFAALTGAPVLTDELERDPARGAFPGDPFPTHDPISHLALAENADVFVVAPATANTLAKLAVGLADSLLTSAALAARCPLVLAPAMNDRMYRHPATRENIERLRARGALIVGPSSGRLASAGEWGEGRMVEPSELLSAVLGALGSALASSPWHGRRVLVTAGGTREPIDAVRFVGNRSSGKMGYALARAALARGAHVTLLAANVALPAPAGVELVNVQTAAELETRCEAAFPECDVLLMAAAVADFRPRVAATTKLKKAGRDALTLDLEPTNDILADLAARRRSDQTVVGFAAEHGTDAVERARAKLTSKQVDALIVNDIARSDIGFEVDDNEVIALTESGETRIPRASKEVVAERVLDVVEALWDGRRDL